MNFREAIGIALDSLRVNRLRSRLALARARPERLASDRTGRFDPGLAVIALTGRTTEPDRVRGFDAGADAGMAVDAGTDAAADSAAGESFSE